MVLVSGWFDLALSFMGGICIGLFYFGGLWWTVRRLPDAKSAGLWMSASFLVRTVVSLAGFYGIMGGEWQRLLAALLGFVAVRLAVVNRVKPSVSDRRLHPAVGGASAPEVEEERGGP